MSRLFLTLLGDAFFIFANFSYLEAYFFPDITILTFTNECIYQSIVLYSLNILQLYLLIIP